MRDGSAWAKSRTVLRTMQRHSRRFCPPYRSGDSSPQTKQLPPIGSLRLVEQRLHRGGEGIVLLARELDDLAALRFDRAPGLLLFLHMQSALEGDRIGDRAAHGALEIG